MGEYLKPLVDFAAKLIPAKKLSHTPVYLYATAGLRLVPEPKRQKVLDKACEYFKTTPLQKFGSCSRHFRVITGQLEGIFGWLSVNYLKDGFDLKNATRKRSFGFLDMGGASTQIAFEPSPEMAEKHQNDLIPLALRATSGEEFDYSIFVTTFLQYGVNEARRRFVELISTLPPPTVQPSPAKNETKEGANTTTVKVSSRAEPLKALTDPCLPSGLKMDDNGYSLTGSGSFPTCLDHQFTLLNKTLPCPDNPCMFNGIHAPIADFRKHAFYGVSEYWYTISEFLNITDRVSYDKLYSLSSGMCAKPWSELEKMFNEKRFERVASLDDLKAKCFKTAWILTILYSGLGMPKKEELVRIIDDVDGFPVSWTLGAMLMHVMESIPKPSHYSFSYYIILIPLFIGSMIGCCIMTSRMKRRGKYAGVREYDEELSFVDEDYVLQRFTKRE